MASVLEGTESPALNGAGTSAQIAGMLGARIRAMETRGRPNSPAISSGIPAMDRCLPASGYACGSLVELLTEQRIPHGATSVALGLARGDPKWEVRRLDRSRLDVLPTCSSAAGSPPRADHRNPSQEPRGFDLVVGSGLAESSGWMCDCLGGPHGRQDRAASSWLPKREADWGSFCGLSRAPGCNRAGPMCSGLSPRESLVMPRKWRPVGSTWRCDAAKGEESEPR